MTPQPNDTHGKALALNLSGAYYGTLAEIGAGQEVARWFLSVGAASGTVAKTISAYDKTFSDGIYGPGTRYVSEERLAAMLDREYEILLERLSTLRGATKRFFVFADTIAARNFHGTNEQHGWVGMRFQAEPGDEPSQILLHINLNDPTAQLQQEAIGILGVNLIYGAFHHRSSPEAFLGVLFHSISTARVDVDVLRVSGPTFAAQDESEWSLGLLGAGMAHALVFDCSGHVVEPAGVLRKRPLLVMRGAFDRPELLDPALFQAARDHLASEGAPFEREPAAVLELTTRHVTRAGLFSSAEMLGRIRQLTARCPVIASDFPETYLLSRYLRRHTTEPVRFVVSVAAAAKILHEAFYERLPGTLLEGLGRLLATNVKIYVAPMPRAAFAVALGDLAGSFPLRRPVRDTVGLDDLQLPAPGRHLFEYLRASGRITALEAPAAQVLTAR